MSEQRQKPTVRERLDGLLGAMGNGAATVLGVGFGLAVPVALYVGILALANSRVFVVDNVEIVGNTVLSDQEIMAGLGLDEARNILSFNAYELQMDVEAMPWVQSADVSVSIQGGIRIEVEESHFVGYLVADGLHLLDSNYEVVRELEEGDDIAAGPLLQGMAQPTEDGIWVNTEAVDEALGMYDAYMSQSWTERRPCRELHYDPVLGHTLILQDGAEVRLGFEDFEARFERLAEVYRELDREGRTPERIILDGSDLNRIAVRLMPESNQDREGMAQ